MLQCVLNVIWVYLYIYVCKLFFFCVTFSFCFCSLWLTELLVVRCICFYWIYVCMCIHSNVCSNCEPWMRENIRDSVLKLSFFCVFTVFNAFAWTIGAAVFFPLPLLLRTEFDSHEMMRRENIEKKRGIGMKSVVRFIIFNTPFTLTGTFKIGGKIDFQKKKLLFDFWKNEKFIENGVAILFCVFYRLIVTMSV